jgi:Nif11 domain
MKRVSREPSCYSDAITPLPQAMTDSASPLHPLHPLHPLQRFQAMVHADPILAAELRGASDHAAFVALVVARAQERGLTIGADDVAAALDAAKRAWMLQWPIR